MTRHRQLLSAGIILLVLLVATVPGSAAGDILAPTATITVDSLADELAFDGNCTLREALLAAQLNLAWDGCAAGDNTVDNIVFALDGTIMLSPALGEFVVNHPVSIEGNGQERTILDAGGNSRIFHVATGPFNLYGMTLRNGHTDSAAAGRHGGAIYNVDASLNLAEITIENSHAVGALSTGGAIYSEGQLILVDSLIQGNSSEVAGGGVMGIGAAVEIDNTVIRDNRVSSGAAGAGGGLALGGGELTMVASLVEDNSVEGVEVGGGGIAIDDLGGGGTVLIERSVIRHNDADAAVEGGGGIYCRCDLYLLDSTVAGNTANRSGVGGGGILGSGSWAIAGSTLSGNSAQAVSGGGIYQQAGTLIMTNSTLSDNLAQIGGALALYGAASLRLSTIAANAHESPGYAGAIYVASSGSATVGGSIVADNLGPITCLAAGVLNSTGYNLWQDASCAVPQLTDLVGADPRLGPLWDYGGYTDTHPLMPGSPAIDAGDCDMNLDLDQRGLPRPAGPACDIGAYEYRPGDVGYRVFLPIVLKS